MFVKYDGNDLKQCKQTVDSVSKWRQLMLDAVKGWTDDQRGTLEKKLQA